MYSIVLYSIVSYSIAYQGVDQERLGWGQSHTFVLMGGYRPEAVLGSKAGWEGGCRVVAVLVHSLRLQNSNDWLVNF